MNDIQAIGALALFSVTLLLAWVGLIYGAFALVRRMDSTGRFRRPDRGEQ